MKSTPIRVDVRDEEKLDKFLKERGISKTWLLSRLINWFTDLPGLGQIIVLEYVKGHELEALLELMSEDKNE